jgi:hypothetical protein
MNKEIREILQITKELEQSSNFKLADEFTNSFIKLAQLTGVPSVARPIRIPSFKPTVVTKPNFSPTDVVKPSTPQKKQPVIPSSNFSTEAIKEHNESIEPTKLEQKNPEKTNKLNEERAQKALKIYNLIKKPNNIYSDYVNNSTDKKFKELSKKVSKFNKDDIVGYILNMNKSGVFTPSNTPIARDILLWAYKMHIINVIPQELGLTGYSRSGKKPGQKTDPKADKKVTIKTKENRSVPVMPTLPTTPERREERRQEEKPEEEREEVRPKPLQMPTLEPAPGTSPMTAPLPLGTPVFPKEYPDLLTPEIMTPITSPKRETTKEEEEETSNGPMTWNEFLSFLNPNYTPGQTPGQTPTQTPDQTLEPSKVNTGNPKPPFSSSSQTSKKQDEEPKTRTVLPFDMKVPETGFATPGGISYMKSF